MDHKLLQQGQMNINGKENEINIINNNDFVGDGNNIITTNNIINTNIGSPNININEVDENMNENEDDEYIISTSSKKEQKRIPIHDNQEVLNQIINSVHDKVEEKNYEEKKKEVEKQEKKNAYSFTTELSGICGTLAQVLDLKYSSENEKLMNKIADFQTTGYKWVEVTNLNDLLIMTNEIITNFDDSFDEKKYTTLEVTGNPSTSKSLDGCDINGLPDNKDIFEALIKPNLKPLITKYENEIEEKCQKNGCTVREAEILKLVTTQKLHRLYNGHCLNELCYHTPLGNLINTFEACLILTIRNGQLRKLMDTAGADFPIFEFVKEGSKLLDLFAEYADKKANKEPLPDDLEEKYRSAIYGRILELSRIYDRMMEVADNGEMQEQFKEVLGNELFHLSLFSGRGFVNERASLETYKVCLENGWAIDDIATVAVFRTIMTTLEKNALSNGITETYEQYQALEKARYFDKACENYLKKLKACYKKIAETPLKDNATRQKFLDEMDELVEEGLKNNLFVIGEGKQAQSDLTARYYAYISNRRKVRDYEVFTSKDKKSGVFSDLRMVDFRRNKLNEYMSSFNETKGENKVFTTSESSEHEKMRKDVERLQKFMENKVNKKILVKFLKADYKLQKSDYSILSSYYNKLDRVAVSAQKYIAAKARCFNGNSLKGKTRLAGALNIREMVKEEKYRVYKLLEKSKSFGMSNPDKEYLEKLQMQKTDNNIINEKDNNIINEIEEINTQSINTKENIKNDKDSKKNTAKEYNTDIRLNLQKAKEREEKINSIKKNMHYYENGVDDAKMFFIKKSFYKHKRKLYDIKTLKDISTKENKDTVIRHAAKYVLGCQARMFDILSNKLIPERDLKGNTHEAYFQKAYNMEYNDLMKRAKEMKDCVMSNGVGYSIDAIQKDKVFNSIIKEAFENGWSGEKLTKQLNLVCPQIKNEKIAKNDSEKVTEMNLISKQNNKYVVKPLIM